VPSGAGENALFADGRTRRISGLSGSGMTWRQGSLKIRPLFSAPGAGSVCMQSLEKSWGRWRSNGRTKKGNIHQSFEREAL